MNDEYKKNKLVKLYLVSSKKSKLKIQRSYKVNCKMCSNICNTYFINYGRKKICYECQNKLEDTYYKRICKFENKQICTLLLLLEKKRLSEMKNIVRNIIYYLRWSNIIKDNILIKKLRESNEESDSEESDIERNFEFVKDHKLF